MLILVVGVHRRAPRSRSPARTGCARCASSRRAVAVRPRSSRIVDDPAPYLNVVLLLTLLATIGGTTIATSLAVRHWETGRRDHLDHRHDDPAVRLRGGDAEDVRDPADRSRRPDDGADPRVPHAADRAARQGTAAARQRDHAGQGAEAGPVRHRAGAPRLGGGRVRGGRDRGRGEGPDPLHLRVRRHDRARGDGAAARHRRDRGRQVAPRRPGARAGARLLADPRLPRGPGRRGRASSTRRTC